MALRPILVDKRSPFLGEACALCKQPLAPGDEIVICPDDATRHHVHCWEANGDKCTAYGCQGKGSVAGDNSGLQRRRPGTVVVNRDSKVQTLPARSFHCAQSCLILSIAVAIVLIAIGCFGLWAIADYIMIDVLNWQYRDPLTGFIPFVQWPALTLHLLLLGSVFNFKGRLPV